MDWEMICRVCLQGGDMVSLFDCDENNELLRDKYQYCSSIEVLETEPLPSNICLTCVDRLMSAYQFRQQCISSNDTLKECLLEFQGASTQMPVTVKNGMETVTIKQENGIYLQYDIPVEENGSEWPLSRAPHLPGKRRRGRPRKYPNAFGHIETSPYVRKESGSRQDSITKFKDEPLESGNDPDGDLDTTRPDSPMDDGELADYTTDPDYIPGEGKDDNEESDGMMELTINPTDGTLMHILKKGSKSGGRRGRPRKSVYYKIKKEQGIDENDEEDVLLKETLLANSEPIADSVLNPKPKEKKKYPKKKYYYEKIHTCDQCGSSFRSNASLQAHIRRHLGIKPFVCNVCGYSCVLNMELRRHMMRHTGLKPYKCRVCDRYFGDFGSRQKHERLHLGERPYQCTLCGKSFTYSYVLSNHMLTHSGIKKYACQPCNKRFTKAHHLKYHNKVHHKEVYIQQQMLQEAKKMQQINISELTTVCTEQLLGLSQHPGVKSIIIQQEEGDEHQEQEDGEYTIEQQEDEQEQEQEQEHEQEEEEEEEGRSMDEDPGTILGDTKYEMDTKDGDLMESGNESSDGKQHIQIIQTYEHGEDDDIDNDENIEEQVEEQEDEMVDDKGEILLGT